MIQLISNALLYILCFHSYIAVTGYPNSTGSEESGFHSSETIASTDIHTTHHHKVRDACLKRADTIHK